MFYIISAVLCYRSLVCYDASTLLIFLRPGRKYPWFSFCKDKMFVVRSLFVFIVCFGKIISPSLILELLTASAGLPQQPV